VSVLVDTSVWVDHFRRRNATLVELIRSDMALTHPMVVLELACGTPPQRTQTLADLDLLQSVRQASLSEVRAFIDREALFGLGCGLVDMMLLTSTFMTPGTQLWTLDLRLAGLAERFGILHAPATR